MQYLGAFGRGSFRWLTVAVTLILAVSILAVRAAPSWALDKSNDDPTVLCTDADGCDDTAGEAPDDPNIYTWDGPISGPYGSPNGYTCAYASTLGTTGGAYNYPSRQMICVSPSGPTYACREITVLGFHWDWDCKKP